MKIKHVLLAAVLMGSLSATAKDYEIMTPESVGAEKTDLVLGKHSGRQPVASKNEEEDYSNGI